MGRKSIEIWVEDKTIEENEGHEEEDDSVKEASAAKNIGEFGVEEGGSQGDRKNDPTLQDGDHLGARTFSGDDKGVLHGGQYPVGKRDKKFHE